MSIQDLLNELHFSHRKNPAALVGENTYHELIREANEAMNFPEPIDASDHIKVGGYKVWPNELPGTHGFWIGEEEDIVTIRKYIKSGYYHENTIQVLSPGSSSTRIWKPC